MEKSELRFYAVEPDGAGAIVKFNRPLTDKEISDIHTLMTALERMSRNYAVKRAAETV